MKGSGRTARWNFDKMKARMLPALLATDFADLLVEHGISVPRRAPHRQEPRGRTAKQGKNLRSSRTPMGERAFTTQAH